MNRDRSRKLEVTSSFSCSPEKAWRAALDPQFLARISFPIVTFKAHGDLPSQWQQGERYVCDLRWMGFLPWGRYEIAFFTIDSSTLRFVTEEKGGAIRSWIHEMQILPDGEGCRWRDQITLDAGALTPFVWTYAKFFYRYRHRRARNILCSS